jgi:hypothetical protein
MDFSAVRPRLRGLPGTAAVSVAAGVLLSPGPALVVSSIAVSPSTARTGDAVVVSGTIPSVGSVSCPAADKAIPTSTTALFPPGGSGPPMDRRAGGAFRIRYTVPSSTPASSYQIGVRCGGSDTGVHATLRVLVQVTRFATDAPQTVRHGASRSSARARWWVIGGALIMGVATFLGVAQWQPRRRRRA